METLLFISLVLNAAFIGALIVLVVWFRPAKRVTKPKANKTKFSTTDVPDAKASVETFPHIDNGLDVWAEFFAEQNWKTLLQFRETFHYEHGNKHVEAIWNMLCDRLTTIESPILSKEFFERNIYKVVFVSDTSFSAVKEKLERFWEQRVQEPCYVVGKNNQLVGFALTPKLIIRGVTATSIFANHIPRIANFQNVEMLTKDDSAVVETHRETLRKMMIAAGVPALTYSHWMLRPNSDNECYGAYDGYNINHPNKYTYYEDDDFSPLLAKL